MLQVWSESAKIEETVFQVKPSSFVSGRNRGASVLVPKFKKN